MVSYSIVFIVVGNDVNTPRVQDEVAMVSHVKGCHSLMEADKTCNKSILHLLQTPDFFKIYTSHLEAGAICWIIFVNYLSSTFSVCNPGPFKQPIKTHRISPLLKEFTRPHCHSLCTRIDRHSNCGEARASASLCPQRDLHWARIHIVHVAAPVILMGNHKINSELLVWIFTFVS